MNDHPEHHAEQAYIDRAYERLDELRAQAFERAAQHARETTRMFGQGYDRDVSVGVALKRAAELDVGDESIIFGRTDAATGERYYIGRRNVAGPDNEPLVIDWRVPAAEPFYRATGMEPLGLVLRRHFLCRHRALLGLEDEHFGDGADLGLAGTGALLAALERPRSGTMRDIAATIRAEQDRIIRAPLEGVLAIQGGPGTGKTAVALHRAAFLLFTHRRALGNQGVLFVGPNRLFLRYVEQVLPALGESGARMAMLEDLVDGVQAHGADSPAAARLKGDVRMIRLLSGAIRDRQHIAPRDVTLSFEGYEIPLAARDVASAVKSLRGRRGPHNAAHSLLRRRLSTRFYDRYVRVVQQKEGRSASLVTLPRKAGERAIRTEPGFDAIVDSIWPLMTPTRLLGELWSSPQALRSAARGVLSEDEVEVLYRADGEAWTAADVPLLDEALTMLGAAVRERSAEDEDIDEVETYAHVVADEVQDLTPMALRMLARRARHASMTIVGDLAQSVGAIPPASWDEIIAHLDPRRGSRVEELTINYRTPGSIMDAAARVLKVAAPEMLPPSSVRDGGEPMLFHAGPVEATIVRLAAEHRASDDGGTMCIVAPPSMIGRLAAAADASDDIGEAVAILRVDDAKGLEFDQVVVAEPARLVAESPQGLRALYVALTRATKRVQVAHAEPLPDALL